MVAHRPRNSVGALYASPACECGWVGLDRRIIGAFTHVQAWTYVDNQYRVHLHDVALANRRVAMARTEDMPLPTDDDMPTEDDAWMQQLDELLETEIEGWRPEKGETLIGTVLVVDTAGEGSTYGTYPLLTVRNERTGQLVNVHAFHTVLRREIARKSIGEGDRVGIKYKGLSEGGGFGTFEDYRVAIMPRTAVAPAPSQPGGTVPRPSMQ